jgi:hypothetical protein
MMASNEIVDLYIIQKVALVDSSRQRQWRSNVEKEKINRIEVYLQTVDSNIWGPSET